jgi:hypothetical protein
MKYCGKFNWHGELHTLWTHASSEAKARRNMIARLATKLGRSQGSVRVYFTRTTKDRFNITKED